MSLGTGEEVFSRNTYLHLVLRALMAYLDTQQHPGGGKQRADQVETKARVRSRWPRRMAEAYKEIVAQLRYHRPHAILLDDPQIMCTTRRDVLAAHIDAIRDIAMAIGIKRVLVGTYDLLTLTTISSQARRMSHIVHFPRYRKEIPQDTQAFRAVLQSLQRQLPFDEEPQLVNIADYCWEHSLGCVGILINWIQAAAEEDLRHGCSTLTSTSLQRSRLSTRANDQIRSAIVRGEERRAAEESQSEDIRS